jgi:hypothetical protein
VPGRSEEECAKDPVAPVGPLLENLAIGEVARQLTWAVEEYCTLRISALPQYFGAAVTEDFPAQEAMPLRLTLLLACRRAARSPTTDMIPGCGHDPENFCPL